MITSQIDTAPKLDSGFHVMPPSLITSQIDTAPKQTVTDTDINDV